MHRDQEYFDSQAVQAALARVAAAFHAGHERLTALDQALGDGDLGITIDKIAGVLEEAAHGDPGGDLGKYLAGVGMAVNRVASSTMGTLLATALLRMGKELRGKAALSPADLAGMLCAADASIQERGKAKLGDKTIVDALHPAAEAFGATLAQGAPVKDAAQAMLAAAREGRDRVTPLQSKVGRSGWIGERTIGMVDGGCETLVMLLEALAGLE
jgi:dihydroxyacetone kinase-like protein